MNHIGSYSVEHLKLKEISYIHSEAYAAGELKHGTISLITDNVPVIALATQEDVFAVAEQVIPNVFKQNSSWKITEAPLYVFHIKKQWKNTVQINQI